MAEIDEFTEAMVRAIFEARNGGVSDEAWEQYRIAGVYDAWAPAVRAVARVALERATDAQPSTAENPNEGAYQRGRFDGIVEYAKAIRAIIPEKEKTT